MAKRTLSSVVSSVSGKAPAPAAPRSRKAAPAPAPISSDEIIVTPRTCATPHGVDWKTVLIVEARANVAAGAAKYEMAKCIVQTLDDSGLDIKAFSASFHEWCAANLTGYTRTAPRASAYYSNLRAGLKAYPNTPISADDWEDFLSIIGGNKARKERAKAEGTCEDTLKMILSLSGTYRTRGGDLETLVAALSDRWAEMEGTIPTE